MHDVANTLIHQIETKYGKYRPTEPPEPENLRKWVESCGIGYGSEGKRFYVVIDGLDHVWRELDHDVSQLDALFRQLFPAIPSVTLIVGTQPLTDKHMPEILRAHRKDLEWLDMPGMTPKAIQDWLSSQVASERFTPSVGQHNQSEYLAELANALFDISSGHPLHIIYSIEMLLVAGRGITTYEIENLPECPNGNIREYYEILSNRLTFLAQDILHLISAVAFLWDTTSLYQVFGENNDVSEALASVRHLTYPTPLGLKPFHGSLAAYVRERFDHEARVRALMPRAIAWLETKAPAYIKWGWLWLTQAKNGNTGDLLRGPSWEWALDGLDRGYSPAQHVRITEQAERIAFRNAEYPRAVELRWLKIRLLNGPDFQTDDFARASGLILGLQKDGYLFEAMLQDLTIVSSDNLVVLGEMLAAYGRNQDAIRCKEEIRKRFNRKVTLQLGPNNRSELDRELRGLFTLFGATGDFDPKYLMTRLGRDKEGRRRLFKTLLLALIRFENVKSLMELSARPKTKAMQKTLELEIVRLACRLSVDLGKWPEFREMTFHPISFCWAKLHKVGERSLPEIELPTESIDKSYWSTNEEPDLEAWIHQHFFWCLGKTLNREILLLPKIEFPKSPWLTAVVPNLQEAARGAAQRLARRESVGFGHVWGFFRDLPKPSGYDEQNTQNVLRRTLAEIATDLALLNQSAGHNTEAAITARDLALAEDSGNFYVGFWRNRCVRRGEALLTASDAQEHVSKILKETSRKVTPFNERTNLYLDLAEFSSLFGLSTLVEQAVHHIVRCLLGYGWRKDYGIFYILDALEACAAAKLPQCEDWVARIAPGVEQIGESTDGDEVGHAREQLGTLLLTVNPSRYVAYYESLLRREEWYIAERVLEAYASTLKDAPLDKALVATLFEGSLLGSIAEQPQMLALLSTRLAELGQKKPHLRDRPTSSEVSKPFEFNAATYPPGQFGSLLDALRKDDRLSFESESINKWVDYWGPIQPNDVLQELEPYFATSDVPYALSDVPDKLFDIATSLQGKKSAYRWLVLAQIQRHGWDPIYGGRSGYHDRLEKAATIYPEKWSDFIQDTSKHTFSGAKWRDTLVIGSSRLVEFLLLARQTRIAIDLTEVMIRCFERELIEQPLPSPDWIN